MFRFIYSCKRYALHGYLTTTELKKSLIFIVRIVYEAFACAFAQCQQFKTNETVSVIIKSNSLKLLSPFLDENNV